MVAEEAPPQKLWGSFATSAAEAMRAQRSAFEGEGWTVNLGAADQTGGTMTARNAFWQATLTFDKTGGERGKVVVRMSELEATVPWAKSICPLTGRPLSPYLGGVPRRCAAARWLSPR